MQSNSFFLIIHSFFNISVSIDIYIALDRLYGYFQVMCTCFLVYIFIFIYIKIMLYDIFGMGIDEDPVNYMLHASGRQFGLIDKPLNGETWVLCLLLSLTCSVTLGKPLHLMCFFSHPCLSCLLFRL